jgi:hypothetical protein
MQVTFVYYRSSGTLGKIEAEIIRKKLLQYRIYELIYLGK